MTNKGICTVESVEHVCIAVRDIKAATELYQKLFGLGDVEIHDVEDQGIRAALLTLGGTRLEFIEPTDPHGGVARFIERRGEGLHHISFEVEGLEEKLRLLDADGVQLIDKKPRKGLSGEVAFIHPRSASGVLIELVDRDTSRR